ncbi:MAG: DUF4080 domain-containing protein [Clostridia bacterium]|nr:DUF4080 domain-containing protein [Clostridia bacterium]
MNIQRVLISCLSSQYIHVPLAPLCLKAALEEACPSVQISIAEANINEPFDAVLDRLAGEAPDLIALCVYIWNRRETARLVRSLKALMPRVPIVVGGPEVTHDVEAVFRDMPIDYLIRGAGEVPFPSLVSALMEDRKTEIPGVCLKNTDGSIRMATPALPPPPSPDLYTQEDFSRLGSRMIYAETSRGCPFSCAFCLSGRNEPVQQMSSEEALSYLIRLGSSSGAGTVKLVDRTFNFHDRRTREILQGLIHARVKGQIPDVCYHMEVAADLFSKEALELLATAPRGLFQMEAGLQSFHAKTLDACNRHTDMERLEHNLRTILEPGNIHLHIDLIAGLPEEDFETFGVSFDRAFHIHPHQLQLGTLKLIPGSALRERDWGQIFQPDPPYEVLSTPWISYPELARLRQAAEVVEKVWNSGRFRESISCIVDSGTRSFDLFLSLGHVLGTQSLKPARYAEAIYKEAMQRGIPDALIRTHLILDWLSFDNTGTLPPFLRPDRIPPERLKSWKTAHPGAPRPRVALLPSGRIALAVWEKVDPVTLRGKVEFLT